MKKTRSWKWCVSAVFAGCVIAFRIPTAVYAQQSLQSHPQSVGVIPDSYGAITKVLLHYDPDLAAELEPLYEDLFQALPSDVRLKVLCPTEEAARDFIKMWEPTMRERYMDVINVGLPISIWARDRYVARQPLNLRGRATTFVPTATWRYYEAEKKNDLLLQDILSEARLEPAVLESSLHIEGGNIVSNRRDVFFGANVFSENEDINSDRLETELWRLFGRQHIALGDEWDNVPWFHVDMYLTPISENTILVASPRFAEELLTAGNGQDGEVDAWDELLRGACPADTVQEQLDAVAGQVEALGYQVYRVPAVINPVDQWMITYNNVLLEKRRGRSIAYMPVYDVHALDSVAVAIYRGLGFEVRTIDVSQVYERGGALRCVANVTQRRPSDSTPWKDKAGIRGRVRLVDLAGREGYDGVLHRSRERLARRRYPDGLSQVRSP